MSEILTRFAREIFEITDETLIIVFCGLVLVATAIVVYWLYNRKRLHELGHQIPAAVLKSYLDSIIQNSTALKSSLFRGGGLDIGEGIPSVVPSSELPTSNAIVTGGASSEELNQKIAEIAALTKRLSEKDGMITDLEAKLQEGGSGAAPDNSAEVTSLNGEIVTLKETIAKLEAAAAAPAEGGPPELEAQLADVTKERDELKERLLEYEIIEEDLANLKRLQQENDQLKNKLASLEGGAAPVEAAPVEAAPVEEAPVEEAPVEAAPVEEAAPAPDAEVPPAESMDEGLDLEAEMAAAITDSAPPPAVEAVDNGEGIPENDGEQKSATELLSEFEKMLG